MPYLNQIVYLGSFPDSRFSKRRSIYGRTGPYFYVIFKDHRASLKDLIPRAVVFAGKPEAVGTDY